MEIRRGITLELTAAPESGRTGAPWTATFRLAGEGVLISRAGVYESGQWKAAFTAAQTAALPPGLYQWEATATDGTTVAYLDGQRLRVLPSLVTDETRQVLGTFAERALEAVEAVLLEASASSELSISVGGQSFSFESRGALLAYRTSLQNEVRRERLSREQGANPDSSTIRMSLTGRVPRTRRFRQGM